MIAAACFRPSAWISIMFGGPNFLGCPLWWAGPGTRSESKWTNATSSVPVVTESEHKNDFMKPSLKPEDFKLTPEEIKDLVTGAQKFLAPEPDPADEQTLTTTAEVTQP